MRSRSVTKFRRNATVLGRLNLSGSRFPLQSAGEFGKTALHLRIRDLGGMREVRCEGTVPVSLLAAQGRRTLVERFDIEPFSNFSAK